MFFALHIYTTGVYTKKHSPVQLTVIQIVTCCILGLIGIAVEGNPIELSSKGLISVLYLGVFSTTIAYLFQNISQKYTTSTHAAILLFTAAAFGTIFAVAFAGERLTQKMIIGCIIMFVAIVITETRFALKL